MVELLADLNHDQFPLALCKLCFFGSHITISVVRTSSIYDPFSRPPYASQHYVHAVLLRRFG